MSENKSTAEWYRTFGDERPPQSQLEARLETITPTASADLLLVSVDMLTDAGMLDAERRAEYFGEAKARCQEVIDRAEAGRIRRDFRLYGQATNAVLAQGEINIWQQVAQGQPAVHASLYEDRLRLLMASERYIRERGTRSLLREFMVPLLGSWAIDRGAEYAFFGRRSLYREGNRINPVPRTNANWDAGVWFMSPANIDSPQVRVESKKDFRSLKGGNNSRNAYARGGVKAIAMAEYNLNNTSAILRLCMAEQEHPDSSASVELHHTTQALADGIRQPIVVNHA